MTNEPVPSSNLPSEPVTLKDHLRNGWDAYIHGDLPAAETSLRQVLAMDPQNVEAFYALGLSFKVQRKNEEARQTFQQVISLIQAGNLSADPSRATMLRHLSNWHIQTIEAGLNVEPKP